MSKENNNGKSWREFKLTTFALNNKSTVILLTIIIIIFGLFGYTTMPRETFPEAVIPYIFVKTIYPGNPPVDIENLITRPIEKEVNTINGIKEMSSTSTEGNSDIIVEFNAGIDLGDALQDVKDAVDRSKNELPSDLDIDPIVMDLDLNEFPILNINLSGDFSLDELKGFAEYLEDEIETFSEISKVEIKGLDNREIQINIDKHKLDLMKLSFQNIEDAIVFENMSISGGDLKINNSTRSVRTVGEFRTLDEIRNIVVKHEKGNIVYLKDVAEVIDGFEDPLTLARLDRHKVVSVQIIKKAGENVINASDKIFKLLEESKLEGTLPKGLHVDISNDQSEWIKKMVSNLENSIVIAMFFVILVLYFFLGARNSLFVGLAIPTSMTLSIVILNLMGSTINMMVLFGLVLALGMLVDNAIVVVENTYRFTGKGFKVNEAAKRGTGEVAIAIAASTATTLGAFFPLAFWPGMMGEFMKVLPVTLIIVLSSSLFVALVIIPVFIARFYKGENTKKIPEARSVYKKSVILFAIGLSAFLMKINIIAFFMLLTIIIILANHFFLRRLSEWFREVLLVKLESFYKKAIKLALGGKRPTQIIIFTTVLMILTMIFFNIRKPKVSLFPDNDPTFFNLIAELPVGSDIAATDKVMKVIEEDVYEFLDPNKRIIKSVLTSIGQGVGGENEFILGNTPNKGMITISFVDYELRKGISTSAIMKSMSDRLTHKYPGIIITINKNSMGPPTGKPINIEVSGKDYSTLIQLSSDIHKYIEQSEIRGIENLKMDLDLGMPELIVNINRESARRFGLSTAQIASTIRTSLFGKDISDFKDGEDDIPIILKFDKKYRQDIPSILDQKITFRSQSNGRIMQVPISSVAGFNYSTTYSAVKRKDTKRVITLFSNVIEGFNNIEVNQRIKNIMKNFDIPEGYKYEFTGEQEDQQEAMDFLIQAMMIALSVIMMILVTQFNSFAKSLIIIASVFFSTIGVFGGIATFRMNFIIIMTGIGIISLAGVVVNNAIVLIDYIDYLKEKMKRELGLSEEESLPIDKTAECIMEAGQTRLRPVLLTAITTILGLFPMAIALNINFRKLATEFDPQLYFGGDTSQFWGPMAWTVIFGLTFATFLTLIVVPVMYMTGNKVKLHFINRKVKKV